jgi:hypothetical protein
MFRAKYQKLLGVALFLLMFSGFVTANFYDLSFRGLTVQEDQVDAGETVDISANMANLAEDPRTDISIEASLVRESDNSVVHKEIIEADVDLASRELSLIEENYEIPENVPEANYSLTVMAKDSSGIAKAYLSRRIHVNNDRDISSVSLGNRGVFLLAKRIVTGDGYTRTYELPSYGTQGDNVLPGTNFTVRFDLENTGTETISPEANIDITPTYSDAEPVKEFNEDLESISPGETREYGFDYSMDEPGTYVVSADIVNSGNNMGSGQVRLVIAGEGGSITDVANSQDVYDAGEEVSADMTIVGPADGTTTVRDAEIAMEIIKDNETVLSEQKTLDTLPLNPEDYTLSTQTDQDLDNYKLKITLGKEGEVYDTYTANYQELDPERTLTEGGEVKDQNACFDDGKCTEREKEIGNCYDCRNVETTQTSNEINSTDRDNQQDEGSNVPVIPIAALLVLSAITVVYWRWNQ